MELVGVSVERALSIFFFLTPTATTQIYTLSLHDALPISRAAGARNVRRAAAGRREVPRAPARNAARQDRKSTRLNSSHANISYAVFCLEKKSDDLGRSWRCGEADA